MKENKVLRVREVQAILRCSGKTVYRLIQRGHLTAVQGIRHKLVLSESVDRFLSDPSPDA